MNTRQAKKILTLYRPGTADEQDSSFDAARQMAAENPELGGWFDCHCASYRAMRQKLLDIPVPPALKEQILSETPMHQAAEARIIRPSFRQYSVLLAQAAAIIAVIALTGWRITLSRQAGQDSYVSYRNRMVSTAIKGYNMPLNTNDLNSVVVFLKHRGAPAGFALPAGLLKARAVGCAIVPWDGKPVSMICFDSGRPLRPGEKSDLWLFVADRSSVLHSPDSKSPAFAQAGLVVTASWSDGAYAYLLASPGNAAFLRSYL